MTVTYDSSALFMGERVTTLRNLLRHWQKGTTIAESALLKDVMLDPRVAVALIDEAVAQGLFEFHVPSKQRHLYKPTELGYGLIQATPMKPMQRKRADRILDDLLGRCVAVNAQKGLPFVVDKVWLFGSYLRGDDRVNDIDVVVETSRTEAWNHKNVHFIDMALDMGGETFLAKTIGSTVYNAMDFLKRKLIYGKRRHPRLSTHSAWMLQDLACECRLVFDRNRGGLVDDPVLERHPESNGRDEESVLPPRRMPELDPAGILDPVSMGLVDITDDVETVFKAPLGGLSWLDIPFVEAVTATSDRDRSPFGDIDEWAFSQDPMDCRRRSVLTASDWKYPPVGSGNTEARQLGGATLVEREISVVGDGRYEYVMDISDGHCNDDDLYDTAIYPLAAHLVCAAACDVEKIARHAMTRDTQCILDVSFGAPPQPGIASAVAHVVEMALTDKDARWMSDGARAAVRIKTFRGRML